LRTQERQRGPVAFEDVLREEANTTVADTHGGWGEAIDVFAMQAVALQLLFRDAVGGCVVSTWTKVLPQFTLLENQSCISSQTVGESLRLQHTVVGMTHTPKTVTNNTL